MKAIANITLIPLGAGISLSPYVAQCVSVFKNMNLKYTVFDWIFNSYMLMEQM